MEARAAFVVAVVAGALALGGCSSSPEPTSAASATAPTATAAPSPSDGPTPSATTSPTGSSTSTEFARRDPSMSDGEALARIASPQTSEFWFTQPRPIPAPEWAAEDEYYGSVHWYELGIRDASTIVGFADEVIIELFEVNQFGEWVWVGAPSAREAAAGGTGTFGFPEVPLDAEIYYDSMTLPEAFRLPTGEIMLVAEGHRGGLANPGHTQVTQPEGEMVDTIGGYTIRRYSDPVTLVWPQVYPVDDPAGVSYRDQYYMLNTPFGTVIPLYYYPFGELSDVNWAIETSILTDAPVFTVDINDIACGQWDRDHISVVEGVPPEDWVPAGTNSRGELLYVPVAENPLVAPLYDAYVAWTNEQSGTPKSLEEFLNGPALLGYESPDTGDWLVFLNGAYSARAWC